MRLDLCGLTYELLSISVPEKKEAGLAAVKGWLREDDAFFKEMDRIIEERHSKGLRAAS